MFLRRNDPEFATTEGPTVSEGASQIRLVPEELPKWTLLQDILQEIEHDMPQGGAPVLIMVNGARTCSQLRQYISNLNEDGMEMKPMLRRLMQWFFSLRKSIHQIQQEETSTAPTTQTNQPSSRGTAPANKRRRVRGGSVAAAAASTRPSLAEEFKTNVEETVDL